MLAYEKDAIKQVPRRGGVDASLSSSSCHFLKLQVSNAAEEPGVSVYPFLCFYHYVISFLLLFVMLIASCFSISWGVATAAALFLACRCSLRPHKVTHFL